MIAKGRDLIAGIPKAVEISPASRFASPWLSPFPRSLRRSSSASRKHRPSLPPTFRDRGIILTGGVSPAQGVGGATARRNQSACESGGRSADLRRTRNGHGTGQHGSLLQGAAAQVGSNRIPYEKLAPNTPVLRSWITWLLLSLFSLILLLSGKSYPPRYHEKRSFGCFAIPWFLSTGFPRACGSGRKRASAPAHHRALC